jgi:hypothetical protein
MGRSTYEDELAFAVAEYLDLKGWLYTHFPAGEYRPKRTGAKLKRMGLKRGVPDMLIFERWNYGACCDSCTGADDVCYELAGEACESYQMRDDQYGRGVAIELKSPKGRPTKEQTEWLAALKNRGWSVHVCRTIDGVIEACRVIG